MNPYISDYISDKYKTWKSEDNIIISSPTGSGKTFFVWNVLFPYARSHKKSIVYFCNRVLLKEQILQEAQQVQEDEIIITNCREDIPSEPPAILIYMYQQFELNHTSLKHRFFLRNIAFYVFDEAHYFLNDALFNTRTNFWISYFRDFFSSSDHKFPLLFLTATPHELQLFLQSVSCSDFKGRFELKFLSYKYNLHQYNLQQYYIAQHNLPTTSIDSENESKPPSFLNDWLSPYWEEFTSSLDFKNKFHFLCYPLDPDYSFLSIFYFLEFSEIVHRVISTAKSEKWLIFVKSKKVGQNLCSELNTRLHSTNEAVFIDNSAKRSRGFDGMVFREISKSSKFSCRVLIATSVMDNGINIKDADVKNIVIDNPDPTVFIQMLGRKRLVNNEKIRLFIRCITAKQLNALKRSYYNIIQTAIDFIKLNETDSKIPPGTKLIYKNYIMKNNKAEIIVSNLMNSLQYGKTTLTYKPGILYKYRPFDYCYDSINFNSKFDALRDFEISVTALIKALDSYYFLHDLLQEYKSTGDPFFFLKQQLEMLGHSYQPDHWLNAKKDDVEQELTDLADKAILLDSDDLGKLAFCCLESLCDSPSIPARYKQHRKKYQDQAKKGKYPNKATFNHGLEDASIPFVIHSKQVWNKQLQKRIRVYYVCTN